MSVRRLAEITLQPASFAFNEAMSQQAETWIAKYPEGRQQSAVIPLLMLAQEQDGWVTKAAIEGIATMLRMPFIRVLEVATFYTQFQLKPVGSKAHVQVCGTTPCLLRGSEALMDVCRHAIHHDQFHLNASGTLSWEEVECLGACVNAPMVMIFKDTYEDLTPERLGEIIAAFERGEGEQVPVGPQSGRFVSAPASGQTTLTDEQVFLDAKHDFDARAAAQQQTEAPIPPSKAARPATDAIETSAAVKSPSPVKVERSAEGAKESEVPPHDAKAADKGEPAVEGGDKERARPVRAEGEPAPYKAPELEAKPQAGESGKVVERDAAEGSGAPAAAGTPSGTGGTAAPAGGDRAAPAAGVDALGGSMGSAAAPEKGPDAPPITRENVSPGPVVEVSESNALPPGGESVAAEPRHGRRTADGAPSGDAQASAQTGPSGDRIGVAAGEVGSASLTAAGSASGTYDLGAGVAGSAADAPAGRGSGGMPRVAGEMGADATASSEDMRRSAVAEPFADGDGVAAGPAGSDAALAEGAEVARNDAIMPGQDFGPAGAAPLMAAGLPGSSGAVAGSDASRQGGATLAGATGASAAPSVGSNGGDAEPGMRPVGGTDATIAAGTAGTAVRSDQDATGGARASDRTTTGGDGSEPQSAATARSAPAPGLEASGSPTASATGGSNSVGVGGLPEGVVSADAGGGRQGLAELGDGTSAFVKVRSDGGATAEAARRDAGVAAVGGVPGPGGASVSAEPVSGTAGTNPDAARDGRDQAEGSGEGPAAGTTGGAKSEFASGLAGDVAPAGAGRTGQDLSGREGDRAGAFGTEHGALARGQSASAAAEPSRPGASNPEQDAEVSAAGAGEALSSTSAEDVASAGVESEEQGAADEDAASDKSVATVTAASAGQSGTGAEQAVGTSGDVGSAEAGRRVQGLGGYPEASGAAAQIAGTAGGGPYASGNPASSASGDDGVGGHATGGQPRLDDASVTAAETESGIVDDPSQNAGLAETERSEHDVASQGTGGAAENGGAMGMSAGEQAAGASGGINAVDADKSASRSNTRDPDGDTQSGAVYNVGAPGSAASVDDGRSDRTPDDHPASGTLGASGPGASQPLGLLSAMPELGDEATPPGPGSEGARATGSETGKSGPSPQAGGRDSEASGGGRRGAAETDGSASGRSVSGDAAQSSGATASGAAGLSRSGPSDGLVSEGSHGGDREIQPPLAQPETLLAGIAPQPAGASGLSASPVLAGESSERPTADKNRDAAASGAGGAQAEGAVSFTSSGAAGDSATGAAGSPGGSSVSREGDGRSAEVPDSDGQADLAGDTAVSSDASTVREGDTDSRVGTGEDGRNDASGVAGGGNATAAQAPSAGDETTASAADADQHGPSGGHGEASDGSGGRSAALAGEPTGPVASPGRDGLGQAGGDVRAEGASGTEALRSSTALGTVLGTEADGGDPAAGTSGEAEGAAGGSGAGRSGAEPGRLGAVAEDGGDDGLAPLADLDHAHRPGAIERPAQPDDLTMIAGIGPKTEALLHSIGIYTFAQIASWNEAQRFWVGGHLRFHGRIEHDNWVGQAKALAEGGEAEYVRVFGRKPV